MSARRVGVDPKLEPDAPPRPIYRADLDSPGLIEGVNFIKPLGQAPRIIRPKCHPSYHATLATYAHGLIRLRCSFCGMTVADLAIAFKGDSPP